MIDSYIQAGKIVSKIRSDASKMIKEGCLVLDLVEYVEGEILKQDAGIAFPCNVSINEVAAAGSSIRWEGTYSDISYYSSLPVVELRRDLSSTFLNTMFGGTSQDALKENIWVPCGDAVRLDNITTHNIGTESEYQSIDFEYSYGDTYYQRWDCLKTYPFTREDPNQVVEIGSFMLETHVNIDGRYDRNRG